MTSSRGLLVPIVGLLALLGALWAMVAMPREVPALDQIQARPHADARHGEDADKARKGVRLCESENLRMKLCMPGTKYGLSIAYWCERPGTSICPGLYATIGGIEKTAFVRPCMQWRKCQ